MVFKCESLRDSLTDYLLETTTFEQIGNTCVLTLPIPTVDGRIVGVFVEQRMGDYFLISDGGKAINELILQGVKITDSIKEHFAALAERFNISYTDEMFQGTGKQADLQRLILAVGTCSGMAMGQLVGHVVMPQEEPIREQFGHALRSWARNKARVSSEIELKGKRATHKFDFVAYPKIVGAEPIVMSVLSPGSSSLGAAERFGFKATDLDSTRYKKWRRVAVEGHAEAWSSEAKDIVRSCAELVIEMPSNSPIKARTVGESLGLLLAS
jgi:hypothetical protein